MFGAIIGDIAGSTYERCSFKSEACMIFAPGSVFTDDTVLTLATVDKLIFGDSYKNAYRQFGRSYPHAGYGASFFNWLKSDNPQPYNSWGNGSAMRVSPIAWAANDMEWLLAEAKKSAEVTHNHPNGIKGAQAVAGSIYLARKNQTKAVIKEFVIDQFSYDLNRSLGEIRPTYTFDVSCEGSVPEAIIAFLESSDFEDSIRKAISLGGDSDTIACITGAIAHAYYGTIPQWMTDFCIKKLDVAQRSIIKDFWKRYPE